MTNNRSNSKGIVFVGGLSDAAKKQFRNENLPVNKDGQIEFTLPDPKLRTLFLLSYDPVDTIRPIKAHRISDTDMPHDLFNKGAKQVAPRLQGGFPVMFVSFDKTDTVKSAEAKAKMGTKPEDMLRDEVRGVRETATPAYALVPDGKDNPAELQMSLSTAKKMIGALDRLNPKMAELLGVIGLGARYDEQTPRFNGIGTDDVCHGALRVEDTSKRLFLQESKVNNAAELTTLVADRDEMVRRREEAAARAAAKGSRVFRLVDADTTLGL